MPPSICDFQNKRNWAGREANGRFPERSLPLHPERGVPPHPEQGVPTHPERGTSSSPLGG